MLPAKLAEEIPWNKLCVDLIGPYNVCGKRKKKLNLKAVTVINPVMRWFKKEKYSNKHAITIVD